METGEWRKVPARIQALWNLVQSSSYHASENPKLGNGIVPKLANMRNKS